MSKFNHTPGPETPGPLMARRPFDRIIFTLSAALLLLSGVVIGRFVVTAQAVDVVDQYDAQLTALRAEAVDLNRQLLHAEARAAAREESADEYRRLAAQQQMRADRLEAQQRVVDEMLAGIVRQRSICLDEIQQYVALNRSIPATDVLRFAEEMFDAHSGTLQQLAGGEARAAEMPSLPAFHVTADVADGSLRRSSGVREAVPSRSDAHAAAEFPKLPSPAAVERTSAPSTNAARGVFFAPPASRKQPGRYVFFAPGRSRNVTSTPASPGIVFHDTATAEDQRVRR